MDAPYLPYLPYVWLALSLIAVLLLDWAVVRLILELFQPASAYLFLAGRTGKLVALLSWVAFFNLWWYPTYLGRGGPVPSMVSAVEMGVLGVLLLLAFTSRPARTGES